MKLNYDYGKISGGTFSYAPTILVSESATIYSPTEAQYADFGYLRVNAAAPSDPAPSGKHYEPDGWEERDGQIWRVWKTVDDTPVYRQWTPLSIKRACGDKWATVKAALETAGIYDEFLMAQYLAEDDPSFVQGYEWACQQYGKDAVDAILDAAEVEA